MGDDPANYEKPPIAATVRGTVAIGVLAGGVDLSPEKAIEWAEALTKYARQAKQFHLTSDWEQTAPFSWRASRERHALYIDGGEGWMRWGVLDTIERIEVGKGIVHDHPDLGTALDQAKKYAHEDSIRAMPTIETVERPREITIINSDHNGRSGQFSVDEEGGSISVRIGPCLLPLAEFEWKK